MILDDREGYVLHENSSTGDMKITDDDDDGRVTTIEVDSINRIQKDTYYISTSSNT